MKELSGESLPKPQENVNSEGKYMCENCQEGPCMSPGHSGVQRSHGTGGQGGEIWNRKVVFLESERSNVIG